MKVALLIAGLGFWMAGDGVVQATDPPAIWIDVPYVAQTKEGCGAAAIAMVMQYWAKKKGKPETTEMDAAKIQELLYSPRQKGIPASAMEKYFQEEGFKAFAFHGEWRDLRNQLEKGRPLIVGLKASGNRGPLHYVVVTGLDEVRGYVFLNDPAVGKMLRISREGFHEEWELAKNWTLLAVPSGEK